MRASSLWVLLGVLAGCGGGEELGEVDGGDGDADADTDVDSDVDSDADGDTDTDSDTGTPTDNGTGSETGDPACADTAACIPVRGGMSCPEGYGPTPCSGGPGGPCVCYATNDASDCCGRGGI